MNQESKNKLRWIKNRLKKKYNIPQEQTAAVLGAISDLRWDWRHSKYDLLGLVIEEVLVDLAVDRCPPEKLEDLC